MKEMKLQKVIFSLHKEWLEEAGELQGRLEETGIAVIWKERGMLPDGSAVSSESEAAILPENGAENSEAALLPENGAENSEAALLLTDDRASALEAKRAGMVCVGCVKSEVSFFDGAQLVTDSLEDLEVQTLEELFLHTHGCPVTIAMTRRLIIREITEEDFEELYRISRQEGMQYALPDGVNCFEREALSSYIIHAYRFYGYGLWSVLKKDGTLIGCCGISDFGEGQAGAYGDSNFGVHRLELQYMLANHAQGQGYAEEMCRAALRFAFSRTDAGEVWLRIHAENDASKKLAGRLGFRPAKSADGLVFYQRTLEFPDFHVYN